uniref:Papain-like cysteine peptidase n=1 Tax=viral metagenome TaxID=1070528 RepID=A0A6C0EU87_9ZZZZ
MVVSFFSLPVQFKRFDAVISLGWNCYPAKYLKKHVKSTGSFFDYIGSPLWSIIHVIENNWEIMFNKEEYKLLDFYRPEFNIKKHGKPNNPYVYHLNYELSFPHDITTLSDVTPEFFSRIKGRIERFEQYCRFAKKLLFIRLQQKRDGLIVENDNKTPEIELLPSFIELIKSKYKRTQINMIFINTEKDGWNEDKTILFVKTNSLDSIKWDLADETIHKLFLSKNVYSQLNTS